MNETEQAQAFEQYMWDSCRKLFEEYGGDWQRLSATEQEVVVLWRAEADIYNGGILQFVCNWGQQHLQQAMTIMDKIGAHQSAALLRKAEQALAYLIDDVRDMFVKVSFEYKLLTSSFVSSLDRTQSRSLIKSKLW